MFDIGAINKECRIHATKTDGHRHYLCL